MSELADKSQNAWAAIVTLIQESMSPGQPLAKVKRFYTQRSSREAQLASPSLHVLDRSVSVTDWSGNRAVGEMRVTFGVSATSYHPRESIAGLETLAFALVDLFTGNSSLDGLVYDWAVQEIDLNAVPGGSDEETQPWVTVTSSWTFSFSR